MNRIDTTFAALKAAGRKGLVGYLTAGDPDAETSCRNLRTAIDAGLDILELGVPFSDPTADGPTIQAAAQRALAAGMTVAGCLDLVRRLRRDAALPIVLFGYANPFFRYGYERLCADAAGAGVDGMLVVDLPFEEADELRVHMAAHGLAFIPLIAPTTPPARAARILDGAGGFVYYIMVTGVTGARDTVAADLAGHTRALRALTDLPIAAGFGVRDGAQARRAAEAADAVVVGSALVNAARDGVLEALVTELRTALDARDPGCRTANAERMQ
jgi:tryptophan synthase alpha chain